MGINFLESFKAYILAKIGADSKEYESVKAQDASLFYLYANDFKEYIASNSDLSLFNEGFNISDLSSTGVSDGNLVAPEGNDNLSIFCEYFNGLMKNDSFKSSMDYDDDGEFTIKDFEAYLKEADTDFSSTFDIDEIAASYSAKVEAQGTEETEKLPDDVKKALDSFYSKEEVIKALDTDGDGKLSDEEKAKFENYLKECFKDGITVDNINKALEAIKDGSFSYDTKLGDTTKTPEDSETQETQDTQQTQNTNGTDGGGYVPPATDDGDKPKDHDDDSSDDKPKDLSSMNLEQLNSEKTTRQENLKEKQDKLGELQSGGGELETYKTSMDKAQKDLINGIKEVDEELGTAIEKKHEEISKQENAITQKEAEITAQEGVVADAKTTWDNAKSRVENLNSSLDELNSVDTSDYTAEQKQSLTAKINELKAEIETAEQAERDAETAYNEANETLDKLKSNEDGSGLEQLQEALDVLKGNDEGQMGDLEKKVSELAKSNETVAQLQTAYNEAKATYETKKTELISAAQDEVTKAQGAVDEVNVAIQNYNNKQDKDKFKNPVSKFDIDLEEKMTESQSENYKAFQEHYAKNYDKYQELAKSTGYPAELIAALHWRESSGDFNKNLQEGGSLDEYGTFENSVKQALSDSYGKIDPEDVQTWLDYAEHYNGMGYTNNNYGPSPYVWAGTSKYTSGKYVQDGVYDANTVDKQIGVAMMLKFALEYKKP